MTDAANSAETAPVPRVVGRPFPKGVSGNPKGRPRGVARAFKEELEDPGEAAVGLLMIARGEIPGVRPADRIAAWRELLDRGYGKAPAFAAIEGHDPLELDEVSAAIQQIADELEQRRQKAV